MTLTVGHPSSINSDGDRVAAFLKADGPMGEVKSSRSEQVVWGRMILKCNHISTDDDAEIFHGIPGSDLPIRESHRSVICSGVSGGAARMPIHRRIINLSSRRRNNKSSQRSRSILLGKISPCFDHFLQSVADILSQNDSRCFVSVTRLQSTDGDKLEYRHDVGDTT